MGARELIRPVATGVLLVSLFTFFFMYPGHDPEPNGIPVGVVADVAYAQPGFEVEPYPDAEAARRAILDREIYGAITPEGTLVASAASFQIAQILTQGGRVRAEDVRPLDPDDPRGAALNLLILPLSITAILGVLLLLPLAPRLAPRRQLIALAAFALLGGLAAALIVNVGIGSIPGAFLAIAGLSALTIMATGTAAAGIIARVGPPGVGLSFMLFLMLGSPASGAASAPELLPDPWRDVGQFLPAGAAAGAVRNAAYFDGAALARPLLVLIIFVALGALLLFSARRPQA